VGQLRDERRGAPEVVVDVEALHCFAQGRGELLQARTRGVAHDLFQGTLVQHGGLRG
jgi:hypothetical protein